MHLSTSFCSADFSYTGVAVSLRTQNTLVLSILGCKPSANNNSKYAEHGIRVRLIINQNCTAASIWFEIWGVVDPGKKMSIF